MDSSLHRFKDKFTEEATTLLDRLEKDLLDLEHQPSDKELVESAFRAMHTIKGVSGMFGFDFICEFTHHMESIYQSIRENKLRFNKSIFEITFQSVDHIRRLLSDEKLANPENQKRHNFLIDKIAKTLEIQNNTPSTEDVFQPCNTESVTGTWHILLRTSEMLFFRGISLINIFKELSALGNFEISRVENMNDEKYDSWSVFLNSNATEAEIKDVFLFIEDDCTIVNLAHKTLIDNDSLQEAILEQNEITILDYIEDSNKQPAKKDFLAKDDINEPITSHTKKQVKRISVDSTKLDHLMFLVSELITINSQLNISARDAQYNKIRPYLEKVDTLSKQFRNNALEIRLVPLGDTVLRFQRLIRDLSKLLDKKVDFITQGTNTELDKNTIDQLTEPLMHIIRNCIDHGIESPVERMQKGKPEQGKITMSAYNSGNNVFISISDDGNGIDLEKVRLKAIDKGLLKPHDKPDKKEIYDLIFMPGFSTAQSLTEVSGRGVGMDIVKKRITDLRGEIIIDSDPGIGTTFTLKLQQSLSIIDSLLFTVDNNYFTVPIAEIDICTQLECEEIERQRHTSTIPYNDHLIPFIDLRSLFNLSGKYDHNVKIIIIRNNEKELALLSDKIVGEHQAVLKPLGRSLQNQKYITSASQMGDGQMAFMIDTNILLRNNSLIN